MWSIWKLSVLLSQFFCKIETILKNKVYLKFKIKYRPTYAPKVNRARRLTDGSSELPWFGSQGPVRVPSGTSGRSMELTEGLKERTQSIIRKQEQKGGGRANEGGSALPHHPSPSPAPSSSSCTHCLPTDCRLCYIFCLSLGILSPLSSPCSVPRGLPASGFPGTGQRKAWAVL